MPRASFPEVRDDEAGIYHPEVTVLPRLRSGSVMVSVDTSDGPHFISADPARWAAILAAITASLQEPPGSPD